MYFRKLEERKGYFEPQVLKIDDTYEKPLSDHELLDDEYDEYHNVKSLEVIEDNVSTISLSSRLGEIDYNNLLNLPRKSAFTKAYEFDEQIRLDAKPQETILTPINPDELKERKREKKRSKSRNRHHSSKHRSPLPLQELEKFRDRSNSSSSNSRIPTGDTGYESISNLSIKSTDRFNNHQPKIVSSTNALSLNSSATNSLSQSNQYLSNNSFTIANRPVSVSVSQHLNTKSTLKNLKTNLTPLSPIKLNPK